MLLIVGVAILVAASAIGEPDLVWAGIFLASLPILSLLVVIALQPKLQYRREITPSQVAVGEQAETVIRLENLRWCSATSLEFRDAAPEALGGGAKFVVARAFGRWRQAVRYTVAAKQRGRFLVGPLQARAGDPLGLAVAVLKPHGEETLLRVTPRIWPLQEISKGIGLGATGEAATRRTGVPGQDDILVREHRHGDDIRRVHWRMTAKRDELMVRLEEHPWDPSTLIISDTRRIRHAGEGPRASVEWVISAATSLAVKLCDERYRIVVAGGSGTIFEPHQLQGAAQRQAIVDAMTDVQLCEEHHLNAIFSESESLDATGNLVFFGGSLAVHDAATLVAIGQRMSKPCAVVMDPGAWQVDAPEHVDAVKLLQRYGWAVEQYAPAAPIPQVWGRVVMRQAAL